ncbi:hypothetical protein [Halorubrum tebenquichense]|uniref:Uncharacterized protein n=1 Tax=Halorubrum tebenquichense DSM 14210 TaxID=1227485 RepID=M0DIW0_9EURY|nr:hypothetical protein [Halorubrum tebenquichense]ELZ35400.1 hypothetical protein C472_12720 [Halorubrum tebenquichense DSM 14210]
MRDPMNDRTRGVNKPDANDRDGTDAELLDSEAVTDDHIPAPAPHVGGEPPRAYELFNAFQIDAGGNAWVSAKYPVDATEVR